MCPIPLVVDWQMENGTGEQFEVEGEEGEQSGRGPSRSLKTRRTAREREKKETQCLCHGYTNVWQKLLQKEIADSQASIRQQQQEQQQQ